MPNLEYNYTADDYQLVAEQNNGKISFGEFNYLRLII